MSRDRPLSQPACRPEIPQVHARRPPVRVSRTGRRQISHRPYVFAAFRRADLSQGKNTRNPVRVPGHAPKQSMSCWHIRIKLCPGKSRAVEAMSSPPNRGIPDGIASGDGPNGDAHAVDSWSHVPELVRTKMVPLPAPWEELFGPLRSGAVDDLVVVGQIGQSLDGRVATTSGHSHYINGPAGLAHLHRLRALVDAVVIGVGTALADDPQLTVRRVAGPQPARVVIDPGGRLPASARMFARRRRAPPGGDGRRCAAAAAGRHRNRALPVAASGASRRRRSLPRWPSAACAAS